MQEKLRGLYRRGKVYWYRWTVAGVQQRVSLATADPAEAVTKAMMVLSRPEISGVSIWRVEVENFLTSRLLCGKYRPRTVRVRRTTLNAFARHCGITSPCEVTRSHVMRYYRHQQSTSQESSAQSLIYSLRAFFSWLVMDGRLRHSPADIPLAALPLPRKKWFADAPTVRQLLSDCTRPDLKFFLMCGFRAGMRTEEIVMARRCWFLSHSLHIQGSPADGWTPKDRDNRTIPIATDFQKFLAGWDRFQFLSPDDYILSPSKLMGRHVLRWDPRRPFRDYVQAMGCPLLTPSGMRTTFASLHVQSGTSVYKVAVWLGDRVDVVQRHYAHLMPHADPSIDNVS